MIRSFAPLALLAATLTATLTGTPALAQAAAGWSAVLRAPLPQARQEIVNSVLWKCSAD